MARSGPWLKAKAPGLHRFLTRRDRPWPLVREGLALVLVILLLVTALYGLTGQPLRGGYPVVVVTTGSMMHCDPPFVQYGSDCKPTSWGRLGTIDPGDLVFVRRVTEPGDVATRLGDGRDHYGNPGDVIVFRPNGNPALTPIIHRALFWVEVSADGSYTVAGADPPIRGSLLADEASGQGLHDPRIEALLHASNLSGCGENLERQFHAAYQAYLATPPDSRHPDGRYGSGFVTRGDNNNQSDQCSGMMPARLDWVLGKARGEVPWIGLVNLLWGDITGSTSNFAHAGSDSKTMFFVVVAVLVTAPWLIELLLRRRARRREARSTEPAAEGDEGEADDEAFPGDEGELDPPPKPRRRRR